MKWDMLSNIYDNNIQEKGEYDETLKSIIQHSSQKRVKTLCKDFCSQSQRNISRNISNGNKYYNDIHKLEQDIEKRGFDFSPADFLKSTNVGSKIFVDYVVTAGENYKKYMLTANTEELNDFLLDLAMQNDERASTVVDLIKEDYDLSKTYQDIEDKAPSNEFSNGAETVAYIYRILSNPENGLIHLLDDNVVTQNLKQYDLSTENDELKKGIEDIIAYNLLYNHDPKIHESWVAPVCSCIQNYMSYDDILNHLGAEGTAFREINIFMIKNQMGDNPNLKMVAQRLGNIQTALKLPYEELIRHFNRYDKIQWTVDDKKSCQSYAKQNLHKEYIENSGNFSDSVIELAVEGLKFKDEHFLVKILNNKKLEVDQYWKDFVMTVVGTHFMPQLDEKLTKELTFMLDSILPMGKVEERELLEKMISCRNQKSECLNSYLHRIMNDNFTKSRITVEKFKIFGGLIPSLGDSMDDNTARSLVEYFILPVCDNVDCAKIIVGNWDFYGGVISKGEGFQRLNDKVKSNSELQDIYKSVMHSNHEI